MLTVIFTDFGRKKPKKNCIKYAEKIHGKFKN